MESNYKRLGNYIQQVDVRNTDLAVDLLLGVSIDKKFIESHANTIGTDFSKYKVVKKGQFAYGPVTSRNGDKISIALLKEADSCLVSSSYIPFEITKPEELNAEYLMILFRNPEFDRFARYNSWGSAREVFSWEDFCDSKLYIPDIKEQQKIVRQYKTITDRIGVLEKINEELEKLIQCTYKEIFITNENYDGISSLGELTNTIDNRGKTPPNSKNETEYPLLEIGSLKTDGRIVAYKNVEKYVDEKTYNNWFRSGHPKQYDILFSTVGSIANFKIFMGNKGCIAQNIVGFRCNNQNLAIFLYQSLLNKISDILSYEIGSVQASIKVSQIVNLEVELPLQTALDLFNKIAIPSTNQIFENTMEIEKCIQLRKSLISQCF